LLAPVDAAGATFKHGRSFAEALPTADFPSVRWATQSAGQAGSLWILQSNT
jgi:hypothetical protein